MEATQPIVPTYTEAMAMTKGEDGLPVACTILVSASMAPAAEAASKSAPSPSRN